MPSGIGNKNIQHLWLLRKKRVEKRKLARENSQWYTRENREYSLEGLRKIVPAALDSVLAVSINRYYNHCARVIDAYADGFKYGTKDFTACVYKGHRKVVDKTK